MVNPGERNTLHPPTDGGEALPYEGHLERAREALPESLPRSAKQVLLALDIDGTLLGHRHVSPRVRGAVSRASEAGINVVIATGRSLPETRPFLEDLRFGSGFMVSANGAKTVEWERTRDGRSVYHPLREWLFNPVDSVRRVGAVMPGAVFGIDNGDGPMMVSEAFAPGELVAGQEVTPIGRMVQRPTTRMIVRQSNLTRDNFASVLAQADLRDVECAVGWTSWADITAKGATKGRGLHDLAHDLGVPPEGTIAIGDGENDIQMLQWAAYGVAMGNAGATVKVAADATTGPVSADGAAAVIEALLERY